MISKNIATQVINQIRQFYHNNEDNFNNNNIKNGDDDDDGDSLESYRKFIQQQKERLNADSSRRHTRCQLISSVDNDCFYTSQGVIRGLIRQLELKDKGNDVAVSGVDGGVYKGGRASLQSLCREINVDCELFLSTLHHHEEESLLWKNVLDESSVTIVGSAIGGIHGGVELVSNRYWEEVKNEIVGKFEDILISDLMSRYSLSREEILSYVVTTCSCMRLIDDSKRLVSELFIVKRKQDVIEFFGCLEEPTHIDAVCQQQGWEINQVLDWLIEQQQHEMNEKESCRIIKGEIHMDSTTSQTATFSPTLYRKRQEQDILEFIVANGYITKKRVRQYQQGLPGEIITLVRDIFPDATVIGTDDDEVVVTENILQQVAVGIQIFLTSPMSEVMDLHEYLPVDLIKSTIVHSILEKSGFIASDGMIIIGKDGAIVISNELMKEIESKTLSRLGHEYAKVRAMEVIEAGLKGDGDNKNNDDDNYEESTELRKGGKSRSKRRGKSSKYNNKSLIERKNASVGVVPLLTVVAAIIEVYPFFQSDETSSTNMLPESLDWENDDSNNDRESLVVSFCRQVLYSPLLKLCERGVNAELQRLRSEMNSKAKISRKDTAVKVRSVEVAFSDAFVTLCHLIQAQAKFILFAINSDVFDEISIKKLEEEFLRGPCADLTSRITQYCLFREEVEEESIFTFAHPTSEVEDSADICSSLPPYCIDVDITARRHPKSYLSCPSPREPLPILRESFSGNTGIVLSRLWKKCGGECYKGGVQKSKEENECYDQTAEIIYVRPGDMDFLSFAEDNFLVLCGLPYKKLDKKAEKYLLFSRKQQLNRLLSNTDVNNPVGVLEYTIMVLFQQVRNLIVFGSLLRGPVLIEALSRERKIPASLAAALKMLNEAIDDDTVDDELVNLIKDCGLVRDINKHDTTILENYLAKR